MEFTRSKFNVFHNEICFIINGIFDYIKILDINWYELQFF